MFNIGDRIVHPMHGAGVIESIEEKEVLGQRQSYYIMKMPIGNLKVMIPTKNIQDIGIRITSYNVCYTKLLRCLLSTYRKDAE